eukprot:CAMPEP_0173112298 /NCGR_PEP_ID=MMETSP1102-20130122/45904_1 /TAXON_ID=49646 /ORGANISM="Geminigera sp., Strain Caron Lab Isolate" /LENGTH=46 /DNA_ID= /DNA_START= /DNA_END= /DNA_ORIENTATION=
MCAVVDGVNPCFAATSVVIRKKVSSVTTPGNTALKPIAYSEIHPTP